MQKKLFDFKALNTPNHHPAKAIFEKHGLKLSQIHRLLNQHMEVSYYNLSHILNGHQQPDRQCEDLIQALVEQIEKS